VVDRDEPVAVANTGGGRAAERDRNLTPLRRRHVGFTQKEVWRQPVAREAVPTHGDRGG